MKSLAQGHTASQQQGQTQTQIPPAWDQVVLSRPLCRPSNTWDSGPVPGPVEAADTEAGPWTRTAVCSAPPQGAWRMLTRAWPTQTGPPLLPVHLAPEAPPPPSGPEPGKNLGSCLAHILLSLKWPREMPFPDTESGSIQPSLQMARQLSPSMGISDMNGGEGRGGQGSEEGCFIPSWG